MVEGQIKCHIIDLSFNTESHCIILVGYKIQTFTTGSNMQGAKKEVADTW